MILTQTRIVLCLFFVHEWLTDACNVTNTEASCGYVAPEDCPLSDVCLKLHWTEKLPYAYLSDNDGKEGAQGIIIEITKRLLSYCCEDCWEIKESAPVNFTAFHHVPESASLTLPYLFSSVDQYYYHGYVPILKNPSSAYVKKKDGWKAFGGKLMSTLVGSWPVLVMALLLSVISGILIWLLEVWSNPDQFPPKFLRGAWEGFWWAFVSMTTVGYGDLAPRSFLGRSFAICWIMVGICISSIFTATLTSALTSNAFNEDKGIARAKVGVLRNSLEAITGIQNQADVVYYNSTDDVWDSLIYGKVEGILLDFYYTLISKHELAKYNLRIAQVFQSKDWSYGVLLTSETLSGCMRELYNREYANILSDAISYEIGPDKSYVPEASGTLSGAFDSSSGLFRITLIACSACTVVLLVIGFLWDALRTYTKCLKNKTGTSAVAGDVRKLEKMEEEMIAEIQGVFVSWKEKMSETKETICLGTMK